VVANAQHADADLTIAGVRYDAPVPFYGPWPSAPPTRSRPLTSVHDETTSRQGPTHSSVFLSGLTGDSYPRRSR
jgi:hypothetical protein